MVWLYQGRPLDDVDIPPKAVGFVYLMTHTETGARYIGRKLLTKAKRSQRQGKVIKSRVESDWREYWSSSPEILKMIEEGGTGQFSREVLVFAENKSQLNYMEECLQYSLGVLETEGWLNSNIRSKAFRKHIHGKTPIIELRSVIQTRFLNKQA